MASCEGRWGRAIEIRAPLAVLGAHPGGGDLRLRVRRDSAPVRRREGRRGPRTAVGWLLTTVGHGLLRGLVLADREQSASPALPSSGGCRQNTVVAVLNYVWFWPNGGRGDKLWGDPGTPAGNAFARTSRRVTERYSEGLGAFPTQARRAAVQMFVGQADDDAAGVILRLHLRPAGDETVRVIVPSSVADMAPQDRARLVLEVVDAAMRRIGREQGWSSEATGHALQHSLDHHLGFEMTGSWKSNPGRKRRARPVARITDDGYSELCFEVADAPTGVSLGFTRAIKTPTNSLPKFKRSASEMRWVDNDLIERPDGWQLRIGSSWGQTDIFDTNDLRPWSRVDATAPERSPLVVEVHEL